MGPVFHHLTVLESFNVSEVNPRTMLQFLVHLPKSIKLLSFLASTWRLLVKFFVDPPCKEITKENTQTLAILWSHGTFCCKSCFCQVLADLLFLD